MSVSYSECDEDSNFTLTLEEEQTAEREHRCTACREPIAIGQQYTYQRFELQQYDDDGELIPSAEPHHETRRCSRCEAIYTHLCELNKQQRRHDEFIAPDLDCEQDYEDEWGDMPIEAQELAFLLPGEHPGRLIGGGRG